MAKAITNIEDAMTQLRLHYKNVEAFYNDPMTAECPCVGDFQEVFDARERTLLSYILEHANKGSDEFNEALAGLEKWMP